MAAGLRAPWSSFAARSELHQTHQKSPRPAPRLAALARGSHGGWAGPGPSAPRRRGLLRPRPCALFVCRAAYHSPPIPEPALLLLQYCYYYYFRFLNFHTLLALPVHPSLPPAHSWGIFLFLRSHHPLQSGVSKMGFPLLAPLAPPHPSPRPFPAAGQSPGGVRIQPSSGLRGGNKGPRQGGGSLWERAAVGGPRPGARRSQGARS